MISSLAMRRRRWRGALASRRPVVSMTRVPCWADEPHVFPFREDVCRSTSAPELSAGDRRRRAAWDWPPDAETPEARCPARATRRAGRMFSRSACPRAPCTSSRSAPRRSSRNSLPRLITGARFFLPSPRHTIATFKPLEPESSDNFETLQCIFIPSRLPSYPLFT